MVSFPNAKINLGLHITEKRPDGYHNLESCFYPVPWKDALEILPAKQFRFTSSGIEIPGKNNDNLCIKIYEVLAGEFKLPPVKIHLHKNIPVGAGLGGGSADAAFTIKILNDLFNLNLSDNAMEEYVRPLGSDCAFFIRNKPVFAYNKGDQFKEQSVDLSGKSILIVYPGIHISSKEAYAGIKPVKPDMPLQEILRDSSCWKAHLKNNFEMELFILYPELEKIKEQLYQLGALYASMSGSGSAIYGIFEKNTTIPTRTFPSGYRLFHTIL
jgi:4-diphosphocytidyl-2-C-methyl-D-erythritol kinase